MRIFRADMLKEFIISALLPRLALIFIRLLILILKMQHDATGPDTSGFMMPRF